MIDIKKMLIPAAAAGAVLGFIAAVFGAIPFGLDACTMCCLWPLLGGAAASFVLKKAAGRIDPIDGAVVGCLGGVVYAVVYTCISTVLAFVGFGAFGFVQTYLAGILGPAFGDIVKILLYAVVVFLMNLFYGVVCYTIGGTISARLLEK